MGLGHSPYIVSSNLVLALDPANTKSYVGSGVTIRDLLGISSAGTLLNGPTYSSNFGGYLNYDGTNDYTSIPHSSAINLTDNITFSMWCRMNDLTYGYYPLSKMSGLNGYEFGFDSASGKMFVGIRNNAGDGYKSAIASTTVNKNIWTHYTGTKSGTGVSIFINGVYSGGLALTYVGSVSSTTPFTLGSANGSYYTPCDISQVLLYSRKLSDDEIKQNYDATKKRYEYDVPIITDGLILNLDAGNLLSYAGSGNSWVDISKNNNIGLLVNGPTYTGSGSTAVIVFDGVNDYARTTNTLFPDTGPFTVGFLYKLTGASGRGGIFERYESGNYNGVSLGQGAPQGPDGWQFTVASDINTGLILSFTFPTTNVWYYDVGVYNGSNEIKIYRNGVFVNGLIGTTQGNLSSGGARAFWIAVRNLSSYLPCHINSVTIYNRALRSSEIYQNYDAMRSRYGL
jgi:hypothetical protein